MRNRIIAYTLFFLGLITYTFFRHYNGRSISVIAALALAIIGLIIFLAGRRLPGSAPTTRQAKEAEAANQLIKDLKTNGERVRVDLDNCEVKENNYTEQRLRTDSHADYAIPIDEEQRLGRWEKTGGRGLYGSNDFVTVQINQTVVVGEVMRFGRPFKFRSAVLPHDRETLLFKMFAQKETTLYIDPADPSRYYLDMEFLSPG